MLHRVRGSECVLMLAEWMKGPETQRDGKGSWGWAVNYVGAARMQVPKK